MTQDCLLAVSPILNSSRKLLVDCTRVIVDESMLQNHPQDHRKYPLRSSGDIPTKRAFQLHSGSTLLQWEVIEP